ncbi:N-acetylglucosamine-6-phosphate deacetylase [Corynebacterium callunae]|uniref:N-acetylglucosamine-6-phosphate deacetylase n=1 Tax=Corynebacterium callunae TaxID=1721 RepID=UPI001FFFB2D4|nr:N-acetylglucosamine-6-phosphate deacetylase [Corynebacterium callunae]
MKNTGEISGRIVTPRGIIDGTVSFKDGHIVAVSGNPAADNGLASTGLTLVPGFIDLHNHGGLGGAFPTGTVEQARRAAQFHRSQGTTILLASLVSAPPEELIKQVKVLKELCEEGLLFGIHLEGPFINACRCGAQNPDFIYPGNPEDFGQIITAAAGWIKSITIAPETPNLVALLELCAQHGIIVSFGHTDADFETTTHAISQATALGLKVTATHLFNAMPPLHHRAPGAAGAMLAAARNGEAFVELVADGVHLSDGTVDFARSERAFFVSDAIEAAGMPDGNYILGVLEVEVQGGVARLKNGGAIAGGTSTIAQQFRRHVARGMTLCDATQLSSTTASRVLGLRQHAIEVNAPLNIVALDSQGQVAAVYVKEI